MATLAQVPQRSHVVPVRRVIDCYDLLDRALPASSVLDMTEGMYFGDPELPYEQAQRNQIEWLLDQARCRPGTRLLDVGCGNGTLLEAARRRGARPVGITVSPAQVRRCRAARLPVRLLDYRNIGEEWTAQFNAVVANGSLEHFVQPDDVLAGRAEAIYRQFFEICHRVLDSASPGCRLVTTVIHTHNAALRLQPGDLQKSPLAFRWGSPPFHYRLLQRGFGGVYPVPGLLARCAAPWFLLEREVDGTQDYHFTSEEWLRRAKQALVHWQTARRIWPRLAEAALAHPRQLATLLLCLLIAQSWQWQFRGDDPPMRLLRQVWARQPA